jgi:hypothetical protein
MKNLLLIILISFSINSKSQIIMEHDYTNASTYTYALNQLMIINFEDSGERYVKVNRTVKAIEIYSMAHALLKTISLTTLPVNISDGDLGDILYISEHLFNLDSCIEFMYLTDGLSPSQCNLSIYNENGTLIFNDSAGVPIRNNVPLQQYPIYNTSQGTKMLLSYANGHAKVYSLPGTLSTDISEANNILFNNSSFVSNPYPNPTNNSTQIDYNLPEGINEGEIIFYDLMGNEVKRYKVDGTFNTLIVSTSDIAAGTYYYQLQTTNDGSTGKKLVVIK